MRDSTVRGILKSPKQGEKVVYGTWPAELTGPWGRGKTKRQGANRSRGTNWKGYIEMRSWGKGSQ